MSAMTPQGQRTGSTADALHALVATDGVASHPYLACGADFAGADGMRDLADAVHFLCILHGRHPGLIDHAAEVTSCPASRSWLAEVASAFGAERLYLTRLAVAAGSVPSTPGSAESEAAVAGQCHALRMLARSERHGCPLGAAIALVADWSAFRPVLDHAAVRLGVPVPTSRLPQAEGMTRLIDEVGADIGTARAMNFGASQVLIQHRGLLDLLDARRSARRDG